MSKDTRKEETKKKNWIQNAKTLKGAAEFWGKAGKPRTLHDFCSYTEYEMTAATAGKGTQQPSESANIWEQNNFSEISGPHTEYEVDGT